MLAFQQHLQLQDHVNDISYSIQQICKFSVNLTQKILKS